MITLEELLKRAGEGEKSFKFDKFVIAEEDDVEGTKQSKLDRWKPYEIKGAVTPEFKIPIKKSNNSDLATRDMLSKVLTFILFTQHRRYKTGCTAMPIPTTSRQNLMIWGNKMAVSRAIKFMIEMGLITVHDEKYRFGVPYKGGNYGKLYAYYKDNEDKVIEYCKGHGIEKYEIRNARAPMTKEQITKIQETHQVKTFEISEVRFGKNLTLKKPDGVSAGLFVDYLTECLYHNYPEFLLHQQIVDKINEFYKDTPELFLRFVPHYHWKNDVVVRIGIRVTNSLCNTKKEDRVAILERYGFNLEKDIKSSVPRLTLSINSGHWIDESVDIYEMINEELDPGSAFTQERREAIKYYHMRSYFEEGSDKALGKNVTYNIDTTGIVKTDVDSLMGRLRSAACKVEGGKFYGSDIFYVESCVYLMTVYDLLTSGHKVWLLYDAFYARGAEDQETFENMINKGVELNFKYFMEHSSVSFK